MKAVRFHDYGGVEEVLRTTGLEPGLLALEVTETGLVRDPEAALGCLRAIRRSGCPGR
jgi:EAL domain-containing protein (putative c-di-GMP-specific phosphodiesterase class I)